MGAGIAFYVLLTLLSFLPVMSWLIFFIWLQFPIYLIHEFEEHAYPGHFKEMVNREVFHVYDRDLPLNEVSIFWINILAVWILFPLGAVLAVLVNPSFGIILPIFGIFNATTHIIMFFVKRMYNPGLLACVFLNYPFGIFTLWLAYQEGVLNSVAVSIALTGTILIHAAIVGYAKYKYAQYKLNK